MNASRFRTSATLVALALVATACSTASSGAPAASLQDLKVVMSGDIAPATATTIAVRNDGKVIHTLALDTGSDTVETPSLAPGATASLAVPALAAGTYRLWCTVPGHREAGMETTISVGSAAGASGGSTRAMTPAEMDAAHEASVKAFPAKTRATGGKVLQPKIVDGVKVFSLIATRLSWEVTPGVFEDAYGYNGQIPGPQLRVRNGDAIRVELRNELPESTVVHFHGIEVPNAMDGVPYITQDPVKPGGSFTYEFTVNEDPGSYMYHSHHNALSQVGRGLYGAFVIEPERRAWDLESTVFLGDGELGYTLNGKGFPATAPVAAKLGQDVLLRFLNAGQALHPMHLHGFHFTVIARDGRATTPYEIDTLTVAPGERYDVVFRATSPGVWALHCHVLSHVESEKGMFGMVTAVVVT